jgi:ribA/ribD-fused uncharacterized protein
MDKIGEFKGKYHFLSNFHVTPVSYGGILWRTSEHAYQAAKTLDSDEFTRIMNAATPGKAKRLGAEATLRPDWSGIKLRVMADILEAKFSDPLMARMLEATGDAELVEGNHHGDEFWGVNLRTGEGKNHLGRLLMLLREERRVFG